jgi:hypothetical protein
VTASVNKSGPYNFLLDTGTQVTMVDPSLAADLHLSTHGEAEVASAGFSASATFADLDSLAAGSHTATIQKVLVYNLENLQAAGLKIQGVLGEDFLEQFDMLIDNAHNLLCLDESAAMRVEVKGQHVALLSAEPDSKPDRERCAAAQVAHRVGSPVGWDAAGSPEARLRYERPIPLQHV